MALSNWDILAIGNDGKSCPGFYQFGSLGVEIYKNWIYLHSEKMYDKNQSSFTSNVIGVIEEGDIKIGTVSIIAKRTKLQGAVFLYATEGYGKEMKIFAGIGCYGFDDLRLQYLKDRNIKYPKNALWFSTRKKDKEYIGYVHNKTETLIEIEDGFEMNPWTGVKEETLIHFKKFLLKCVSSNKDWFNSIRWDELLRYNQGDAFFAKAFGEDIPASEIGQQDEPLLIQDLK